MDSIASHQTTFPLLERISDLLICPACSGRLSMIGPRFSCVLCNEQFAVRDGVPLLARRGTAETWDRGSRTTETSEEYQRSYKDVARAAEYNAAYKEKLFKRWSTRREFKLLGRLLSTREPSEVILDLPCGGGRLSPSIAPFCDLLIEADIGEGQVFHGKKTSRLNTPQLWMTASAFHIPLQDDSVDGVVCSRLCHHLPTATERERLVGELLRVARRFVIMTFFDHHSLKNTLRRMRRPLNHKPPKMTMTVARVRELAEEHGARLVACPMLSVTSSGHRYALIEHRRA